MDLELHITVWNELKEHFVGDDTKHAADDFVRTLIEHGADATQLGDYSIDSYLKSALSEYIEHDEDESDDYYEDDDYEY